MYVDHESGYDIEALRAKEFPWTLDGRVTYLNHAGTGPLPQRAITAMAEWAALQHQPWRAPDRDIVFPMYARAREACARLIGVTPAEIALVPNTSYGLNIAVGMLPLGGGDKVITSAGEFPSVVNAWRLLRDRVGVEVELVPRR